jgi:hypothetical protein
MAPTLVLRPQIRSLRRFRITIRGRALLARRARRIRKRPVKLRICGDQGQTLSMKGSGPTSGPYSPECVEGALCELRVDGVLRNSSGAMRATSSPQPGSKLLGARYQTVRSKQAVGETPRSKSEVLARRLSEGEARLTSDRGAARNPYLGGVATAREPSPTQKARVGSGTGIKPYDRADREESAAAAGAVATCDGAVDPRGL